MKYDLLIVGGGPAGLTLAWKVAEKGHSVLVVDKKKQSQDAGYLTSGSFIDLKKWNLPKNIGQPIESFYLGSKNASHSSKVQGRMINRKKLLTLLAQRAKKAGAKLLFRSTITKVKKDKKGIQSVTLKDGQEVRATVYADCSGVGRVFERHFSLVPKVIDALGIEYLVPLTSKKNTIDLFLGKDFRGGYGWLFPLDNKIAILGYGTMYRKNFKQCRQLLDDMFTIPRIQERTKKKILAMHSGIFRTGKPLKKYHHKNLILVGDVCLQGNPVVGEGIRFVMDAARIASEAVGDTIKSGDIRQLVQYSRNWKKEYYAMYRAGFYFQRLLYHITKFNGMTDKAIRLANKTHPETVHRLLRADLSSGFVLKKALRTLPKLVFPF